MTIRSRGYHTKELSPDMIAAAEQQVHLSPLVFFCDVAAFWREESSPNTGGVLLTLLFSVETDSVMLTRQFSITLLLVQSAAIQREVYSNSW